MGKQFQRKITDFKIGDHVHTVGTDNPGPVDTWLRVKKVDVENNQLVLRRHNHHNDNIYVPVCDVLDVRFHVGVE